MSRKTLSRVESGQEVRQKTLRQLEQAFGLPESALSRPYSGIGTVREVFAKLDDEETVELTVTPRSDQPGDVWSPVEGAEYRDLQPAFPRRAGYRAAGDRVADDPTPTVDEVFAAARHLPLNDLRRLAERLDAVITFLDRPQREVVITRAVSSSHGFYRRWRHATTEAELARRQGDTATAERWQRDATAAREELDAWLERTVPDLSKTELAEVLTRIQQEAGG
jgi:transcriptional regulator with XRE-family HTH domain